MLISMIPTPHRVRKEWLLMGFWIVFLHIIIRCHRYLLLRTRNIQHIQRYSNMSRFWRLHSLPLHQDMSISPVPGDIPDHMPSTICSGVSSGAA